MEETTYTVKQLLESLIGTDNTTISNGVLVPDYSFILSALIVGAILFMLIKGVFALCKR